MERVPRNMDRHLQRIMENATPSNDQSRPGQTFNYSFADSRPAEFAFRPALRQSEDPMLLNEFDQGPSNFYPSHQPLARLSNVPTRLSLGPRYDYKQPDNEPRTVDNADHHFRFAQNFHQGHPVKRRPSESIGTTSFSNRQAPSPLTQLANNMLLQRPMPQASHEHMNIFQGLNHNRLNELQPRGQEITPPFNLNGFVCSASTQQPASSSSPFVQQSSPTTRVFLRRAANRTAPAEEFQDEYGFSDVHEDPIAPPETHQQHITPPATTAAKYVPQALALGHAPPMAHGIQLISPHQLPDRFRYVFPYELFNAAQSKCFDPIYKSNDNVVVSAPTGSGKTALLELAICKLVEGHPSGQFKIVYQAPTKSLCSERMRDWQKKFSHLNLACVELTGDTSYVEMNKVGAASIIITTPEKWDSITRKWKDYSRLLQLVRLFLIDEVHILKDTRGATLEAVVSRMKSSAANVRFVALSATVPNSQDIATWLGKDHTNDHIPAHRETFGEDFRPVKLQKHVYGYDGLMNQFAFEKILDGKLPNLIQKHSHKKPIMVFCFTRKSCEQTAGILAEWWTRQRVVDRAWPTPAQRVKFGSKELQELAGCGVAFHHAGLDPQDRHAIENGFLKGDISVICCTSTLAVGVNLPCHLVVLKGTMCFQNGSLFELSDLEVMQMLGRAGRPQFDDNAVAIIMTRSEKADRYKKMISGQDVLESTLHLNLIEHLNSEIGLGTVHNIYTAKKWLAGTFLSVRMRQNPDYYKLEGIPPSRDADERLGLVCERDIKLLEDHELVKNQEGCLLGTEYGQAMSRYMVQFETMKLLLSLPSKAKTEEILYLLCQASEFKDLRIKPNERASLRELNKSPLIKFPIKENISTTLHKVSLIIQAQLGGVDMSTNKDFTNIRRQFDMEKCLIFERAQRLIRCIVDCKAYDCDAIATRHALDLARSLSAGFWENSNLQLRQIPQVGPATVRKLASSAINSVGRLASLDTATIERLVGKNPPFGRKLLDSLAGFPRLTLAPEVMGKAILKGGEEPKVNVKVQLGFSNVKVPVWSGSRPSLTFMAETSDGKLVHVWRGNITKLDKNFDLKFVAHLPSPDINIKCSVACDEIVGTLCSCRLDPDVPASAFPKPKPNQATLQSLVGEKKARSDNLDEFGTDSIDDDEFLAAVEKVEAPNSESDSSEYADIDDFDDFGQVIASNKVTANVLESFQMENGKWTCAHQCRGGKILRNGQTCKHKCCKEGLDKRPGPRRLRTNLLRVPAKYYPLPVIRRSLNLRSKRRRVKSISKASGAMGTNSRATSKASSAPKSKLKVAKHSNSDQQDVEVIDLAEELSPMPYSKLAPREYRKLHNLHKSVQKLDTSMRLPKQKPQFSYKSGNEPDLPFLRKAQVEDDAFDLGESAGEDFPSPSALAASLKGDSDEHFDFGNISYEETNPNSSSQDPSMGSLEARMLAMDEPTMSRASTPKINSSFGNGVFELDAFEDKHGEPEFSSPLMRTSRKRARSRSPALPETKHHRVEKDGYETDPAMGLPEKRMSSASSKSPVIESQKVMRQALVEENTPTTAENIEQRSVPAWVNEFDADLIASLMGIVDFVE